MDRIIRILTAGKLLGAIDQEIVHAIQSGSRVLVKAGSLVANFPAGEPSTRLDSERKLDSENSVVAKWAEVLAHEHGLVWLRVGSDVLFTKAPAENIRRRN